MLKETFLLLLAALSNAYHTSVDYIQPWIARYMHTTEQQVNRCGICHEPAQEHQACVATCDQHQHCAHVDCMRAHLQQDRLYCPTCQQPFASDDMEHILMVINDGDVVIPIDTDEQDMQRNEHVECSLCLEACDQQWPQVVTLHCQEGEHQFHVDCLERIMNEHTYDLCPNCRHSIAQEDRQLVDDAYQFVHGQQNEQELAPSAPPMGEVLPECAICFDNIEDDEQVLPCAHQFHTLCINQWLAHNATCPTCRAAVR